MLVTDMQYRFQILPSFQSQDRSSNATFSGFFGAEKLRLYTHFFETDGASQTLVENSTVNVATQGAITPGRVGIGSQSTLLRDLAANDMIAGKTYSLYIGHGFDRAGGVVNGSNVFGGYDSGRFTGVPHKYPMKISNANAMGVNIKDIILTNSKDNSNVSLFDPAVFTDMKGRPNAFEAQITTDQFPLSFPYQITKNFIARTGAEKDNTWGDNSLRMKNPYNGTLTIVLDDGFTVIFPPSVLMNASNITPIQDRTEDSKAPFYLGAAFLGQVYLMANYETNEFHLAKAIQKNNMVMPVTYCPKGSDAPVAYTRPQQSEWQKQGLIGAVIGGVIGGIGCIAAMYCLWVVWMRKKDQQRLRKELKKNKEAKMAQFEIEEVPEFDPPPSKAAKVKKVFAWGKK